MEQKRIGIALRGADVLGTLDLIGQAEQAGVEAAWLTTGGTGPDGLTTLAVAAARTSRIRLGTAITPTYPRHPLALAQQAQVLAAVAPGRFTLGVGPSHAPTMEGVFGLDMGRPLDHLREYVMVLKGALAGAVDFDGAYYRVHARVATPAPIPVMISALRRNAFRLAGEIADGAISWLCPPDYLARVALPALADGAASAGRSAPRLVAHAIVCRTTDGDAVRRAMREQFGGYPRLPFYARMLADAGYPEALQGELSDRMIDALVIWGDDSAIKARLRDFLALGDVEALITPLAVSGQTSAAAAERLFEVVTAAGTP